MSLNQDIVKSNKFATDILKGRTASLLTDGPTAPNRAPITVGDLAVLGELLGRAGRKRKGKKLPLRRRMMRARFRGMSTAQKKAKLAEALKKATPAQKATIVARLKARAVKLAARKAKIKAAIKRNPKLRKRIVKTLLLRKLQEQRDNPTPAPYAANEVPQGASVSPPPSESPVQPAVEECHTPTPAERVETMQDNAAEDTAEAADEATAEAEDEGAAEVEQEEEDSEEAENEDEMTEPSQEEADEEAAEDVEAATTEGDGLLGRLKKAVRKKAKRKLVLTQAKPTAKAIERASKGKIKASTTMQGCALIQAAKAGNPKAKAAIKVLQAKAAKGDPAAVKAVAQLKVCGKVLTKSRKTLAKKMGTSASKKRGKRTVYNTQVKVVSKGLQSYSAHQRGLAMIPAAARQMFRRVG